MKKYTYFAILLLTTASVNCSQETITNQPTSDHSNPEQKDQKKPTSCFPCLDPARKAIAQTPEGKAYLQQDSDCPCAHTLCTQTDSFCCASCSLLVGPMECLGTLCLRATCLHPGYLTDDDQKSLLTAGN